MLVRAQQESVNVDSTYVPAPIPGLLVLGIASAGSSAFPSTGEKSRWRRWSDVRHSIAALGGSKGRYWL